MEPRAVVEIMSHADNVSDTMYKEHRNARRKELHRIRRAAETPSNAKKEDVLKKISTFNKGILS